MAAYRSCNHLGGIPASLELSHAPEASVSVGDTTAIEVKVRAKRADLGTKYMTGAANYGPYFRWDLTGKLAAQAKGTILINIYTPRVGTSGQGRYMPYLELPMIAITGVE